MASNYSTAFIFSSTLRVEAEQMLPILFSIYHRLKFNLSWCARRFLLQYAYILALRFACCAAFLLPGGGRWCGQISRLALSLLNHQLDFISPEDNNSRSAGRMSSVLLLFASAVAAQHRRYGRNEQLMLLTSSATLRDILCADKSYTNSISQMDC